jgi:hypothetical protein
MRWIIASLLLLLLAPNASAQILKVKFKDQRTAKRFKKFTTEVDGELVILGEAKSGIKLLDNQIQRAEKANEIYVANTADPEAVPYLLEEGQRVPANRKAVAMLNGNEIGDIQYYLRYTSLYALAREYAQRKGELDQLSAERDNLDKTSRDWFFAHRKMLKRMERLQIWLRTTLYREAAKKLQKQIDKERKVVAKEAAEQRAQKAISSVKQVDVPQTLQAMNEEHAAGKYKFRVQESQHVRLTYFSFQDERITELLRLAETMIDDFRALCVDPYLGDDFPDAIPDGLFVEYYFGPNNLALHEHVLTEHYKQSWGAHRQKKIESASCRFHRKEDPQFLQYWNIEDHSDVECIVAHGMGHTLTNLHYNMNRPNDAPQWLEEAVAYYLSLEYLGENSVTCREFKRPTYDEAISIKEGEKIILKGERELYNSIALSKGPSIDGLAVKSLYQMQDPDFAKGWSLFDYVIHREARAGQQWLRDVCEIRDETKNFLPEWRTRSEKLFEVNGTDVFKVLDKRWKAYAETYQRQEPKKPRRR